MRNVITHVGLYAVVHVNTSYVLVNATSIMEYLTKLLPFPGRMFLRYRKGTSTVDPEPLGMTATVNSTNRSIN